MKKIIHIVHGKANPEGANGISRVVYFLNKYQKIKGLKSEIWAFVDGVSKHESYRRDEFVTVEVFPRLNFINQYNHPIIERFKREKSEIDIVHFHMIWFFDKNILAKKLNQLKIPFVAMTHGTYSIPVSLKGKKRIAQLLYERKFLNRAIAIHALTPEEVTALIAYGVKRPCFVVPNGMEPDQIPSNLISNYFDDKPFKNKIKIGWIGVFRKDKNLDMLIKACSLLPHNIREKFHFVLMGPNHKNIKEDLIELAERLNVREYFEFYDAVYEKEKYDALNGMDIYIMTSSSEGLSLAILDAMALEKPCILTRGCNMTYYFNKGFFEMCEPVPQEIAKALERILENRDSWITMGKSGRKLIDEKFNWYKVVDELQTNYNKILLEQ